MSIYLFIVLIGLVLKLWVSYYALSRERANHNSELNNIISLAAITIVTFSIPQFFLLADGALSTPFGIPRYFILRWYLFHGLVGTTIGVYFILAVFYSKLLARKWIRVGLLLFGVVVVLIGTVFILFSDAVVDTSIMVKQTLNLELGKDNEDTFLIFTRSLVAVIFTLFFLNSLRKYTQSSDHKAQIINLYAVIALFLSVVECIAAVFFIHPLLFAVKGVFFTVVIFLACSGRKVFDARPLALVTLEAKISRDMQRIFRGYAHSEFKHKEAMQELEKILVSYKLEKVSGFRNLKGSPLPDVAENMDVKLSTLYELLKRLGIRRPKN